ncbi:hypothetical protein INR49_007666 [Caranx melampygus]|nr:hypothetical protein INR49_007666 [Caranx melampygus]
MGRAVRGGAGGAVGKLSFHKRVSNTHGVCVSPEEKAGRSLLTLWVKEQAEMAATTAQPMGSLPSGLEICTTAPDILYLPELVFGGLVWILVASTHIQPENPLGWVMFVSVFCFVVTFLWMVIFAAGCHKNSSGWAAADFAYHGLAAFFYLSAAVVLAYITTGMNVFRYYQIDIAAVVFAHLATLLYFIHAILSAIRWKSF